VSGDDSGDMKPEDFPEVTPGTERDATDPATDITGGNRLPADPEQLEPEVVGVRHGMFGVQGTGDTSGYGGLVRPVVMPGGTPRPYGGWFDDVADALVGACERAGVATGPGGAVENRQPDLHEAGDQVRSTSDRVDGGPAQADGEPH
jgi:NADH-quinone oxidoreductase subunit C